MTANILEFTVSEFSNNLKTIVEDAFGYVKISGEVTGFKKASSGHLYFSLKDGDAILQAVCFKKSSPDFEIKDGMQIAVFGKVSTYQARSNYQIIVDKIEIAGIGAILEMIEKRRQKLQAEGLFDEKHKKKLPFFPRKIAVITSSTGAVIQDILNRIQARSPCHIMIYSSLMQGKDCAKNVIKGIKFVNNLKKDERPELIIIARGGGSFEDLLPFNDEELIREVFASELPIISAIGHETDTTLIDFVSDVRAATPTAAAEIATIVLKDIALRFNGICKKINFIFERNFLEKINKLKNLEKNLKNPKTYLQNNLEKLNFLEKSIKFRIASCFESKQIALNKKIISKKEIENKILFATQNLANLNKNFIKNSSLYLQNSQNKLMNLGTQLKDRDYHEILKRGFTIIHDNNNNLLTSIEQIKLKNEIKISMKDGEFSSYVLSKNTPIEIAKLTEKSTQTNLFNYE